MLTKRHSAELRGSHDALDRPASALRSTKRGRRTPECFLQAAQCILPSMARPLVTTDDAGVVVAEARVCPVRVRHVAAPALVSTESVHRAAAGGLVSTECVLRVAKPTLVSLDNVLSVPARALVSARCVRHVAAPALVSTESVRRAAAGGLVSTECVLRIAKPTLVSPDNVVSAPVRVSTVRLQCTPFPHVLDEVLLRHEFPGRRSRCRSISKALGSTLTTSSPRLNSCADSSKTKSSNSSSTCGR